MEYGALRCGCDAPCFRIGSSVRAACRNARVGHCIGELQEHAVIQKRPRTSPGSTREQVSSMGLPSPSDRRNALTASSETTGAAMPGVWLAA